MNSLNRLRAVLSFMQFDSWLATQEDRALLALPACLATELQETFQPHLIHVAAGFSAMCRSWTFQWKPLVL